MQKIAGLKDKATGLFRGNVRYEEFEEMPKHGYDKMDEGGGRAQTATDMDFGWAGDAQSRLDPGSPESIEEIERPPLRHIDKYVRAECPCLSQRYTVAVMTCLGFMISFGIKCNLGMAKLRLETLMANRTESSHGIIFNWTVGMESAVDSSFFWGYFFTQIPGGFLASMYPANRIFGTAIVSTSFLNLLMPGAMDLHPSVVILVRVLQGLVEGVTYPACHGIWRFWAPPLERSRLATIAFCGSYAGVVVGMPLSGILAGKIGWQAPFYFYGVFGLIWFVFWLWLTFEKPRIHPVITVKELRYIEQSLGESTQIAMPTISTTPWRKFATSMPVYAIIVANFCRSWNFYLLVIFQSAYLQNSFDFKIEETGLVGALPHLLMATIVPFGGLLADHLRKSGLMSTTTVRKVFNCGGFGMEGMFFLVVAHAKTAMAATTALTFGVAFSGFAISGYNVNHLDIAPRYASILMGLSNGIGTIAGLICPITVDHITREGGRESWKTVFILAATIHFIGITFYALFASGEPQPWAEPTEEEQKSWNPSVVVHKQVVLHRETSFGSPPDPGSKLNPGASAGYGAVEPINPTNPFAYANPVAEERVQPEATDSYMHGGSDIREYHQ